MKEKIKVLITEEEIKNFDIKFVWLSWIKEIACDINRDYYGEDVVLVCVLNGAVYFAVDLSKELTDCNVIMDFVKISSYGVNARKSSGNIDFKLDIRTDIKDKNVIIIEDIIDSGNTLSYLYDYLLEKCPKSLKICVLLDKKARRVVEFEPDYTAFPIDDLFVVGYGLDYDEKLRNLPFVGYVKK